MTVSGTGGTGNGAVRRVGVARAGGAAGVAGAGGIAGAAGAAMGQRRPTATPVYVISVAAELSGVHPQTLRVYERKGLLDPSRTSGGSRRFSERDLARLRRIQDLTAAGLNLEGVRRVLELETELDRLRTELDEARTEALEAIARVHRHYRRDLVPFDPAPVPYIPPNRRGS